jgi:hypothetical protein
MSSPSAFKASTATRMSLPSYVLASVLALPLALIAGCPGGSIGPDPYVGEFTPVNVPGCTGKCAVRTDCPVELGGNMKLRGTVNIPAGNLPVYNARVYIPLDVMPGKPASGASCDRCSNTFVASTFTSTNPDGSFELTDVPAGENIPLVISVGKWQRIITLPKVEPCGSLKLDPETTRLPRNQSEGNIPKIALTTGGADAMECLLRKSKLGIDDSEFTLPDGTGRVNLYAGGGYTNMGTPQPATSKYAAGHNGAAAAVNLPTANPWWDTQANWDKYDVVVMSCEGVPGASTKSTMAKTALKNYLDKGGRVFASHYHSEWLRLGVNPLNTVATFAANLTGPDPGEATIDETFDKGKALSDYLILPNVAASTVRGKIPITQARYSVQSIAAAAPTLARSWAYYQPASGAPITQYFSFDAPVGVDPKMQCGQMVFSDLHVSAGLDGATEDSAGPDFPSGCRAGALSPQEKALIFMLFDLSNCLSNPIG